MNDLNSLIQKIMNDADFRKELAASPEEALTKNGFEASEDLSDLGTVEVLSGSEVILKGDF